MNDINTMAAKLKELRDRKEELSQATKDNNAAIEETEQKLAAMMIEEGNDSISLNGYKFTLSYKDMFSSKVEYREQLIDALKLHGIDREEIITETIPTQKLNSIMRDIYEKNGETLPEEFAEIVSVYSKSGVTVRKESGKAGMSKTGKKF